MAEIEQIEIIITGMRPTGEGTWYIDFRGKDPLNQVQIMQGYIPGMTNEEFFGATSEQDFIDFVRAKLIGRLQ